MTRSAIVGFVLCAACGGSAPPAAAPSASTEAPPSAAAGAKGAADAPASFAQPSSPPQSSVAPSPAPQQPPPPPPPQEREAAEPRGVDAALRVSRADLSRAEGELEASLSDCRSACHALGSMERATGHLCDLASDHEDRRSCEDAKTRVLRARDRIRSSCGTCPDGSSLDRTAPIPSRP